MEITRKPRTRRVRRKNKSFVLEDADLAVFDALQGGPLATHYLHEAVKHLRHDETGNIKRLRQLFDLGFINKPQNDLNNKFQFYRPDVYSLEESGLIALGDRRNKYVPFPKASIHNFWNATLMANLRTIEGFLSGEEIIRGKACPEATRREPKPLKILHTEPDDLFGIEYDEGHRFFAVETDLANENYEDADLTRKSTAKMIRGYRDILESGEAKRRFGIPNLFVLIFTPRESRTKGIMKQTEEIFNGPCKNILFKTVPLMQSRPFRAAPLMPEIVVEHFLRAGESNFDILNPVRQ